MNRLKIALLLLAVWAGIAICILLTREVFKPDLIQMDLEYHQIRNEADKLEHPLYWLHEKRGKCLLLHE
jgi:hypothetical protein